MSAPFTVKIDYEGPFATHNMPCAICHTAKAILNCNTGHFHPCWGCQKKGYGLRKKTPVLRLWGRDKFYDERY